MPKIKRTEEQGIEMNALMDDLADYLMLSIEARQILAEAVSNGSQERFEVASDKVSEEGFERLSLRLRIKGAYLLQRILGDSNCLFHSKENRLRIN